MSGFYYRMNLVDLDLTASQLNKIRAYIRERVRSVAAVDSGVFLRSISTSWDRNSKILTVYSLLFYSGFIEGGNINYIQHKNKVGIALSSMGLKPSRIAYF